MPSTGSAKNAQRRLAVAAATKRKGPMPHKRAKRAKRKPAY